MLVVAAALFHDAGLTGVDTIEGAHAGLEALVGGGAALAFAVALLASGLSSSSVGTYAGQVVMQGFIAAASRSSSAARSRWRRRWSCSAIGLDPTDDARDLPGRAAFGIPFALVPMILLTRRSDVMGALVNRRSTTLLASVVAALIIALNVFLLFETFFG